MTRDPARDATVEEARKHLMCDHPQRSRSGGNDYIACGECGFEWDYRRVHDPRPHAIDALIAALRVPPAREETNDDDKALARSDHPSPTDALTHAPADVPGVTEKEDK